MSERVVPHSLEAEKAALGSILVRASAYYDVAAVLGADDFFRDAHRRIFLACGRLVGAGRPVDPLTVRHALDAAGDLDEVGGASYVMSLTDGVPAASNAAYYAEIVAEASRRRRIIHAGTAAVARAYETDGSSFEIAASLAGDVAGVAATRTGLTTDVEAVERYLTAVSSGEQSAARVMTGYADLDKLVGGLRPAELTIVAARPSTGKSSFALGMADHMARVGASSLFVSLEMGASALAARMMAWRSSVETSRLESGEADAEEYARVAEARASWSHEPKIYIHERARALVEVSACARQLKQRHGVSCVFVDYLQLLIPERRHASREVEVSALSRGLKSLAQDVGVPVVALSQLSRASEARRDKRPQTSDLRESGALEQDADAVVLLFRPEMYKKTPENAGVAEAIVAKNRNGPTGVTRLQWEARLAQFRDLA